MSNGVRIADSAMDGGLGGLLGRGVMLSGRVGEASSHESKDGDGVVAPKMLFTDEEIREGCCG